MTPRTLILILLFCSTAINYIDRMSLAPLLPAMRADLAISPSAYGNVTTLFLVAYAAGRSTVRAVR